MCRPMCFIVITSLCCNTVLASSLSWRVEKTKRPHSIRNYFGEDTKGRNDADEYPSHGNHIVLQAQMSETGMGKIFDVAEVKGKGKIYLDLNKATRHATDNGLKSPLQMLRKSKRHTYGTVYIPLSYWMKNIVSFTHIIDFMSVTRALTLCIRKVYLILEINIVKVIPWDDLTNKFESCQRVQLKQKISDFMDNSYIQNGCQLDYGSIRRMPSISSCIMESNDTTNNTLQRYIAPTKGRCDAQFRVVLVINSTLLCSESQRTTIIAFFKSAWMLAKINYGLILSTTLCVLIPTLYKRVVQHHRYKSHSGFLFVILNLLWMTWRLQETLHWDTKWQYNIPYICVATNTIRYLVEGMLLFLFAWTSFDRYQAIVGSLVTNISGRKNKLMLVISIIGLLVGGICSSLHIVALFTITGSPTLLKTCHISHNISGNLTLLIVAKVISLVAMNLVPCIVMSTANIVASRSVKRKTRQELGRCYSKKQRTNKTTRILNFLVFSSMFMVCCVSKPIFEVYVAVKIHVGTSAWGRDTAIGVLLNSITWNLTTIAFTINTALGLLYTK